jgi:4-hydroxy-3-methylbut-2-enyl diphosphate reductase
LLAEYPLDLMIVLGGHNSSNTYNLARICAKSVATYHVADPASLLSEDAIEHRPGGGTGVVTSRGWLPPGPVRIGLTSGASTPDSQVGAVIRRLETLANPVPASLA